MALIWVVALLGWTGVRMLPDRYVSTARIYADADAVLGMLLRGIAIDNSPAAQVEVLQRTLVSRPNLERIVDRSALSQRIADGADREKIIQALARDLRFGIQARNLFTVEYVDTDPRVAQDVVQHVVDLFLAVGQRHGPAPDGECPLPSWCSSSPRTSSSCGKRSGAARNFTAAIRTCFR